MVPGGTAWPSRFKFFGFSSRTWGPCRFCGSRLRLPWLYLSEIAICLTIGIAPMWEEIGWRGFAQPRIQRLYGPCSRKPHSWSAVGVWHLPFFFGPLARTGPETTFVSAGIALVEFSIGLTGLSVVMAWVLNNCGGSTLMAILLHACFDSSGLAMVALFPSTPPVLSPNPLSNLRHSYRL